MILLTAKKKERKILIFIKKLREVEITPLHDVALQLQISIHQYGVKTFKMLFYKSLVVCIKAIQLETLRNRLLVKVISSHKYLIKIQLI